MKVIAESAYNHMGEANEVIRLLEASKGAGADFFTIQIMNPHIFSDTEYSKHQLYIDHNISYHDWDKVFAASEREALPIIPCPLDEDSFDYVMSKDCKLIKIHATDLTNPNMLAKIKEQQQVRVLLETQAATGFEIRYALREIGEQVEAILTGYSNYPTEFEDLNLNAIDSIRNEFGFKVGYADHSPTVEEIPLMCLAKNCDYLEKHITLSRNTRKFDWQVSLYPEEFSVMCSKLKLFAKTLGNGVKHPVENEKPHRNVLYKKVLPDGSIKRADNAPEYVRHQFQSFSKDNVSIGIIARLKSQRLPKKVMKELGSEPLIRALYKSLAERCKKVTHIELATSTVREDDPLAEFCINNKIPVFRGHPESVIDRLLDLAWQNESGYILRVTGDNPYTDPGLIDEIISLAQDNDLDYAKVNNCPFGMSAEVFSTPYLWDLYIRMENPMVSEYLTWFILLDKAARKGSVDLVYDGPNLSLKNLSVDYPEDLEACRAVLKCTGETEISNAKIENVLKCTQSLTDKEDAYMKLPGGKEMLISEYIQAWKDTPYAVRKPYKVNI